MKSHVSWLALDIGGANLKGAHHDGQAESVYFPLWKFPDRLASELNALAGKFPKTDSIAVTMTAELCDCYETKREGVLAIISAVVEALPGVRIWIWGVDGRFHSIESIRQEPLLAAASNWLATATAIARRFPTEAGLLIDIGSTTTDLIPFENGRVVARGRNDLERLRTGELVYAGVSRTPVCALTTNVVFRGERTGLAAELFATTRDIHLTLGDVAEDPSDIETADGRPATKPHARDRLARMVCADRESFSEDDVLAFSEALEKLLLGRLAEACERVLEPLTREPKVVVTAGSGEFLARRLCDVLFGEEVPLVSLAELWGSDASTAACARALLELLEEPRLFPENDGARR